MEDNTEANKRTWTEGRNKVKEKGKLFTVMVIRQDEIITQNIDKRYR